MVTGIGVMSPNGIGRERFFKALSQGQSGVSWVQAFDASKCRVKICGEIPDFDPSEYLPDQLARKADRFAQLGLVAAQLALEDAGLSTDKEQLRSAAVVMGSGQGGLLFHEQTILRYLNSNGTRKVSASAVPRITSNAVTAHIAIRHGITGMNQVISTACSSGAQAIGQAARAIKSGLSKIILTGGVEAPISPVMLEMYNSMMVLAGPVDSNPARASRPFDRERKGFVLSE